MNEAAFSYFIKQKQNIKKSNLIEYNDCFKMAAYLKSGSQVSKHTVQQIFTIRSENLEVAANFSKKYNGNLKCVHDFCDGRDDQKHLYQNCSYFQNPTIIMNKIVEYEEIFGENVQNQVFVSSQIMKAYLERCRYISPQKEEIQRNPD